LEMEAAAFNAVHSPNDEHEPTSRQEVYVAQLKAGLRGGSFGQRGASARPGEHGTDS